MAPYMDATAHGYSGLDLRGVQGARPWPPTKPFIFYFPLMTDAHETTT